MFAPFNFVFKELKYFFIIAIQTLIMHTGLKITSGNGTNISIIKLKLQILHVFLVSNAWRPFITLTVNICVVSISRIHLDWICSFTKLLNNNDTYTFVTWIFFFWFFFTFYVIRRCYVELFVILHGCDITLKWYLHPCQIWD